MPDPLPLISVIVPVFNDAERLRLCLDALAGQTYPRERLEVWVVDNGSDDPPRELVASLPFGRFAEESQPGSYAARNRGLALAGGSILAFTDSDCIPTPDWLAAGQRALEENPNAGFVGGHIEVFPRSDKPTALELYDMIFGLQQRSNVEQLDHAATANMLTRRSTIDRTGPFNEELKSGGDFEWGQRATAQGLPGVYCESAVVRHPARHRWADLVRQRRRHAGGRFDRRAAGESSHAAGRRIWHTIWVRFVPNFRRVWHARCQLREWGYGWFAWLRVTPIVLAMQYVTTFESMRRRFGTSSERR